MKIFKIPKGCFSKIIVVVCILEMIALQLWAMRIASHNGLQVTGLITANHSVFGGELLMLCLKRIFAKTSDDNSEMKNV